MRQTLNTAQFGPNRKMNEEKSLIAKNRRNSMQHQITADLATSQKNTKKCKFQNEVTVLLNFVLIAKNQTFMQILHQKHLRCP
jgi:hypothetical protein